MARHRPRGVSPLLQKFVKLGAGLVKKKPLRNAMSAQKNDVKKMEAELKDFHDMFCEEHDDLVDKFYAIGENLFNETFLYVSNASDVIEVYVFKSKCGYGGAVKIEGNSAEMRWLLSSMANVYGLEVIE